MQFLTVTFLFVVVACTVDIGVFGQCLPGPGPCHDYIEIPHSPPPLTYYNAPRCSSKVITNCKTEIETKVSENLTRIDQILIVYPRVYSPPSN